MQGTLRPLAPEANAINLLQLVYFNRCHGSLGIPKSLIYRFVRDEPNPRALAKENYIQTFCQRRWRSRFDQLPKCVALTRLWVPGLSGFRQRGRSRAQLGRAAPSKIYCTGRYARQVGTSGAGGSPGAPGLTRNVPSETMQKFRTPLWLNVLGSELPTKSMFVREPPVAKPAPNNWYPLLAPLLTLSSRMQAVTADGEQGSTPPRLIRLGANPICGYAVL